ncbi:hypothetical protein BJ138DRAFT_1176818 [Hygrophoropsis aurantiaca]|uniref:Uncharacterized protein n=1 Tax=Hygrophoropsis aurantiaca TaxID=72124 RepID=A0ACB8ARN5_9AGAM|nr:hypothetical protein BJ138DRAFT_1176818 [Hygrophoropsis aurantiaca]
MPSALLELLASLTACFLTAAAGVPLPETRIVLSAQLPDGQYWLDPNVGKKNRVDKLGLNSLSALSALNCSLGPHNCRSSRPTRTQTSRLVSSGISEQFRNNFRLGVCGTWFTY